MGGEGSGRHADPVKRYAEQRTPIATTPVDAVVIPDFDGVAQHEPTLDKFDKRYAAYGTTGGTGENYWVSGSNWLYPRSTSQGVSGSYILADNTVSGSYIEGDGSRLLNLPAGGAAGIWKHTASGKYIEPISGSNIISGSNLIIEGTISGSTVYTDNFDVDAELTDLNSDLSTHTTDTTIHYTSGSIYTIMDGLSGSILANDADITGLSGASLLANSDRAGISGSATLNTTNIATNVTNISTNTTNTEDLSGSLRTLNTSLSGSYFTHAGDSSDPHGATLTQTTLNSTNISNTGDHNTSGSAYCLGVIMDPSATPPTASNFPQGTIYLQYTA